MADKGEGPAARTDAAIAPLAGSKYRILCPFCSEGATITFDSCENPVRVNLTRTANEPDEWATLRHGSPYHTVAAETAYPPCPCTASTPDGVMTPLRIATCEGHEACRRLLLDACRGKPERLHGASHGPISASHGLMPDAARLLRGERAPGDEGDENCAMLGFTAVGDVGNWHDYSCALSADCLCDAPAGPPGQSTSQTTAEPNARGPIPPKPARPPR